MTTVARASRLVPNRESRRRQRCTAKTQKTFSLASGVSLVLFSNELFGKRPIVSSASTGAGNVAVDALIAREAGLFKNTDLDFNLVFIPRPRRHRREP